MKCIELPHFFHCGGGGRNNVFDYKKQLLIYPLTSNNNWIQLDRVNECLILIFQLVCNKPAIHRDYWSFMDGLPPGTRYIEPWQKHIPPKSQMSDRPLDLKLQNKFRPLIVVIFIYCCYADLAKYRIYP